jgi:hypothetical protein
MVRPVVAPRGVGDGGDAPVAAVAESDVLPGEWVCGGVAGDHDVVAVGWPAAADDDAALVGGGDDLGVDAGLVVLGRGGNRLIMDGGEGGVDDRRR